MTGKQRPNTVRTLRDATAQVLPAPAGRLDASLRLRLERLALRWRTRSLWPFAPRGEVLDRYVGAMPSLQNAIDAVPGWIGAMPPETGLRAGTLALHLDHRIDWLLRECFDVTGRNVLELGPLEGFHTFMLERSGAAAIDAIEANAAAYLRCLVTKEALKLRRASFLLGDFMQWFEDAARRYDLVVASGVLYHSSDPVRLLEGIAAATDSLYLWSHVFDEAAMPAGDKRRLPFSGKVERRSSHGIDVRLHERSYLRSWRNPSFNGGLRDRHYWVDRGDLLALLAAMGFDRLTVADDEPGHRFGPSLSIFAQRSAAAAEARDASATPAGCEVAGRGDG